MRIEWNETYSIGNSELDEQHKKWIGFYNELHDAMTGQSDKELHTLRVEVLEKMAAYVDYHFRFEEDYMRSIGYPDVDKHWRLHKNFRDKIYRLCREHEERIVLLNSEVMNVIKNWIIDHILHQDMKIMEYLHGSEKSKPPTSE